MKLILLTLTLLALSGCATSEADKEYYEATKDQWHKKVDASAPYYEWDLSS